MCAMNPRLLRPLATGFNPKSIAGLGMWLDASNTSSLTFNGSTVSEWRDLSGGGRHFTQATAASQPDGVSRTYNGLRVLDFDGTQHLEGNAATLGLARNVGGVTIFAMQKYDTAAGLIVSIGTGVGNIGARAQLWGNGGADLFVASGRRPDSEAAQSASFPADQNGSVLTGVWDFANAAVSIFQNGVVQDTNSSFHTPGLTDDTDSEAVFIGAVPGSLYPLNGFIAELLVYRRVLPDAQRSQLEQHLIAKWNPQPEPAP